MTALTNLGRHGAHTKEHRVTAPLPAERDHIPGAACWCRPYEQEEMGGWADTYAVILVHRANADSDTAD